MRERKEEHPSAGCELTSLSNKIACHELTYCTSISLSGEYEKWKNMRFPGMIFLGVGEIMKPTVTHIHST